MMFYISAVIIDKSGYNEYIRKYTPEQLDKIIDVIDDEEAIYGYTIGLPNSHPCFYDQLWFIEAGDEYIPLLIQDINISSGIAMWSRGIYPDDEAFFGEDNREWNLDRIIDFIGESWKKGLKKSNSGGVY